MPDGKPVPITVRCIGIFHQIDIVAAKITAFLLTLVLNATAGVVIFFTMLVVMNGYSGSDAEYGLGVYIVLALTISAAASVGAFLLTGRFLRKPYSAAAAAIISIAVFSVAGALLKIVSSLIGVGVAEHIRVNY